MEARCFEGQIHTFFVNAHLYPHGLEAVNFVTGRLREAFAASAAASPNS